MTLFSLPGKGVYLLPKPKKDTMELEVKTLRSPDLSTIPFLFTYQALSLFKNYTRRHKILLDGYSRHLAQSLCLGKAVGDWESGVRVEK